MKQSALWTKTSKDISREEVSINAQLLTRAGMIDKVAAGIYSYLPLGYRVLTKIENIIREEMNAVNGLEVLMPALQPKEQWVRTGRWDTLDVLFRLQGSGDKEYALGATHEEIVTPLIQRFVSSYKVLPVSVYQIQTKFRDEPRAKSGLLRGREFRMKDMYSFHLSEADLNDYYERVTSAYMAVYRRCGIGDSTYLTFASGGAFSKYSHEFQTVTEFGEDTIHVCEKCRIAINKEILAEQSSCPTCDNKSLTVSRAIEVGNIFKLQTRFSSAFDFVIPDASGKNLPIVMGCYGIGSSRIMGAIVEMSHDQGGIVWPDGVAPFAVHLVSLANNDALRQKADALYEQMTRRGIEVLYDDREGVRPGEKFAEADLIGIPTRMVVSEKTLAAGSVEVKKRKEAKSALVRIEDAV